MAGSAPNRDSARCYRIICNIDCARVESLSRPRRRVRRLKFPMIDYNVMDTDTRMRFTQNTNVTM